MFRGPEALETTRWNSMFERSGEERALSQPLPGRDYFPQ
jgi:hypothetical protein